jgi:hypothetical protein
VAEVDRVVNSPYPTQLKVGTTTPPLPCGDLLKAPWNCTNN